MHVKSPQSLQRLHLNDTTLSGIERDLLNITSSQESSDESIKVNRERNVIATEFSTTYNSPRMTLQSPVSVN